ncbi:MAG: hypothetical protein JF606_16070 [Burkholderiales bacterium]|nr:hypothetical protein [Burkholderiales bacterium]
MSILGEIHASLDAIGVEQQVCVFAFLMSYPLALGGLLDWRGRHIAAGVSVASVAGFAFFTDPWFHAVVLVVLAVGATGVFIAAVYVVDRLARNFAFSGLPIKEVEFVDDVGLPEPALPEPEPGRHRLPIVAIVSVKH